MKLQQRAALPHTHPKVRKAHRKQRAFGALYLELEAEGRARIELGGQTFTLDVPDKRTVTHQVLLHDAAPALRITALAGGITLTAIRAKVVAFEQ